MIAFAKYSAADDALVAFVRRILGGKEFVMSEYASRMAEAIDELFAISDTYNSPDNPMPDGVLKRLVELDGRVEALRIRLGIEHIPPSNSDHERLGGSRYGAITDVVGYSRIGIHKEYHHEGWDSVGPARISIPADEDWRMRMQSLRALASELAIVPELDQEEEAIVTLLVKVGRRLTTTQILDEFSKAGLIKAESTIKGKLAQLTRRKVLVNRTDTSPKGYGLPEWQ